MIQFVVPIVAEQKNKLSAVAMMDAEVTAAVEAAAITLMAQEKDIDLL
jgi:hypothetical protein